MITSGYKWHCHEAAQDSPPCVPVKLWPAPILVVESSWNKAQLQVLKLSGRWEYLELFLNITFSRLKWNLFWPDSWHWQKDHHLPQRNAPWSCADRTQSRKKNKRDNFNYSNMDGRNTYTSCFLQKEARDSLFVVGKASFLILLQFKPSAWVRQETHGNPTHPKIPSE